jgi:hypothetical protein
MKMRSIASEVLRNVVSGTAHVPLLGLLLALTAGLAAGADVAAVHGLQNQARTFITGGGATRMLVAEDSVDRARCESLDWYRSVQASGALRQAEDLPLDALAGAGFPVYEVTAGFASLLDVKSASEGAWVSEPLAESLGVATGSTLATDGRDLKVGGIFAYPDDGRDARLEYAIVMPVEGAGVFDECWMRAWPQGPDDDGLLRQALASEASTGTEVSLTQLNRSMGTSFTGTAMFDDRLTRWAPAVAAAAGLLIGFAAVRARRLEHASALHAGQSRGAMTSTAILEAVVWSLAGAVFAGAVIYLSAGALAPEDVAWVPAAMLPSLVASFGTALAGVFLGTLTVREADLFRLFKER